VARLALYANSDSPILNKYNPNNGNMKISMFTGSPVGVITADKTAITTIAARHPLVKKAGLTTPTLVRTNTNRGSSKLIAIQKIS
jgi:hypothetical protein